MSRFFNTTELPLERKREILLLAKERCDRWWVDVLDCSKSFARQRVEMTFEEVMEKFTDRCTFTVIHRDLEPENHLEVGFRAGGAGPDYFLWLIVDVRHLPEFESLIGVKP